MNNKRRSLRERLWMNIITKHARHLTTEPSEEHPGYRTAYFKIDNWHGFLLKLIDPKRFQVMNKM